MNKTILITGASSGIGKATAGYFQKQGWNVAATMRTPEKSNLTESDTLKNIQLDVLNRNSIRDAIKQTLETFGSLDVVLNNAGYGAFGPIEMATDQEIDRQFKVNVHGLVAVMQETLPHFRKQKSGRFINISSAGGKITIPLGSVYHGTKFAVEGITEGINYELNPLGIDAKLVEPGAVATDFGGRSINFFTNTAEEYKPIMAKLKALMEDYKQNSNAAPPINTAKVIYKAATTKRKQVRFISGTDAKIMLFIRKFVSTNFFMSIVRKFYKL